MIIVVAKLKVKLGKKAELLAAAKDLIAATRQETGCISYSLLEDPYVENSFSFIEEWSDKAVLQSHFTTPHIAEWRQKSADLRDEQTVLTMYQAEETKL
ncbi:MAG: Antibiotic biosynthesis monooxygenase [Anaerosporomusa subterranea]|jgi:quinol monooxygenase YgiN|nr:Antibiotic biosynthesis monooxygenase [Anaerosporomusa subterranea]